MIEINNLKKIYGQKTVVDVPQLTIRQGELIGLVGNNGAGKNTLMRLILDLIRADEGWVSSDGELVNESERWKAYTGSFIDGRFLIDFFTPEEYFSFIAKLYGIGNEEFDVRLRRYEGLMNGEILGTRKYLRDFSEGNRQKVGIIGAMLIEPRVLILDEPFNYLDPSSQITIRSEEYFSFIAKLYGIGNEEFDVRLRRYEGLMNGEILGTRKYLRDFSEGNRQKVGIIGAMLIEPRVLILDEPFNYLDPSSQITI